MNLVENLKEKRSFGKDLETTSHIGRKLRHRDYIEIQS